MTDDGGRDFEGPDNPDHVSELAHYRSIPDKRNWPVPKRFVAMVINQLHDPRTGFGKRRLWELIQELVQLDYVNAADVRQFRELSKDERLPSE